MACFNNSNKPFLCERNKEKVFLKQRNGIYFFQAEKKVAKKPPCGDSPRSNIRI